MALRRGGMLLTCTRVACTPGSHKACSVYYRMAGKVEERSLSSELWGEKLLQRFEH